MKDDVDDLLHSIALQGRLSPEKILQLKQKLQKKPNNRVGAELEKLFKEPNETK